MGRRIVASLTATLGAAALTLACMIALVQGTIVAVTIDQALLRVLAIAADSDYWDRDAYRIYLATHLAVLIVGVGCREFPPLPNHESSSPVPSGDSPKI